MKNDGGGSLSEFSVSDSIMEMMLAGLVIAISIAIVYHQPEKLDVILIVDLITAVIAISVALIKAHINKLIVGESIRKFEIYSISNQVGMTLDILNGEQLEHARRIITHSIERLEKIREGILPFNAADYFDALVGAVQRSGRGTRIEAVNSINTRRWEDDPRQVNYLDENIRAIRRGATIDRIFIIPKEIFIGDSGRELRALISRQKNEGIIVSVVYYHLVHSNKELTEDFVVISGPKGRILALKDYADTYDNSRVAEGEVIVSPKKIEDLRKSFNKLKNYSVRNDELSKLLEGEPVHP